MRKSVDLHEEISEHRASVDAHTERHTANRYSSQKDAKQNLKLRVRILDLRFAD
jgi:hypothetical protein